LRALYVSGMKPRTFCFCNIPLFAVGDPIRFWYAAVSNYHKKDQ
jgi:hypothetical protein